MAKTVLITGTSTGIGRACADRMAAEGWTVYAGVRRKKDGDALVAALTGDVRPVLLDVTKPTQLKAVVKRLTEELAGRGLDGLVNNAGVAGGGPMEAMTDADWQEHFEINVFGVVRVTRELLPLVIEAKGRVVNIASIAALMGLPMFGPYSAGKHAVAAISESLRFEMADFGVKVSCVQPGEVQSSIWEKGSERLAEIESSYSPEIVDRYQRHIDMLAGFLTEGPKKGVPAARASRAVHHALTATRPKARYMVGPDAKQANLARRVPDWMRPPILGVYLRRWEKAGRKLRANTLSYTSGGKISVGSQSARSRSSG